MRPVILGQVRLLARLVVDSEPPPLSLHLHPLTPLQMPLLLPLLIHRLLYPLLRRMALLLSRKNIKQKQKFLLLRKSLVLIFRKPPLHLLRSFSLKVTPMLVSTFLTFNPHPTPELRNSPRLILEILLSDLAIINLISVRSNIVLPKAIG